MARELLIRRSQRTKPTRLEVENIRRQMVKEWKLKSVLFGEEDDAKKWKRR
jgi:hypothetical protein